MLNLPVPQLVTEFSRIVGMKRVYLTKIPLFLARLVIGLFILWVAAKIAYPLYAPKLSVKLEIEPTQCSQLEYLQSSFNPLFSGTSVSQVVPINPQFPVYLFSLNGNTRTALWQFCSGVEITVKKLTLISPTKEIAITLEDTGHLNCLECKTQIQPSGKLKLIPNPRAVSLQLGGIYEYMNAELPRFYLILYRLPQIITALFLILFAVTAVPLTLNLLEYIFYCFIFCLAIISRWPAMQYWFPAAGYTSKRLIADAQYLGFPLRADFTIMACLLAVPFILGLVLLFRNHILCRQHPTFKARLLTLGLLSIILFWFISL